MRVPRWSIAALLILGSSTAVAIGTVICDPTLSPYYNCPTAPGWFQYPGQGTCTCYYLLPDGGRIPVPPGDAGAPPKPAADAGAPPAAPAPTPDTLKSPNNPAGWGDGTGNNSV